LAEAAQRGNHIREFALLVKAAEDECRASRFGEGSQARPIKGRNGRRLNVRRAVRRSGPDGIQLRGSPMVMRKGHAKQVEIGDGLKRGRQLRQELAELSVTTDQIDDTDQRLDAYVVGWAVNTAYATWRHGFTRRLGRLTATS
jgi:hypothetical protein